MATTNTAVQDNYDESSIQVLEGLEPVRKRPGMYTRTDDPTHIVQEVIDNAFDEGLGGHARNIAVTVHEDGSVLVSDDGRGIPVGPHPVKKIPVVTLAFNQLHAGGKFEKGNGGAYAFSGGLHGVGVAVTTALSKLVRVNVSRNGRRYEVEFADGGRQIGNVKDLGPISAHERVSGTTVQVWPDPQFFEAPNVSVSEITQLLRSKAVMLPGVCVTLTTFVHGEPITKTWRYEGGLPQYLQELAGEREMLVPIFSGERYHVVDKDKPNDQSFADGEGAAFSFTWFVDGGVRSESFVNLIPTPQGGTHESGLKKGVFEAVKAFVEAHKLLPKGVQALHQEDVCSRMGWVLSARVLDPQFQGQVKEKLNSRDAVSLVSSMVRHPFETWLNTHVDEAKKIAALAINQALTREKADKPVEKRRGSGVIMLPGKLADCEAVKDNELFLVEGDSAGGSAKQGRDRYNQAILPLRGKLLNTWEVERGLLFKNKEIHDLSVAVGVEPHGLDADKSVLAKLRYTRTFIMTDADVDGSHIRTLLLTAFLRHFPMMLVHGHVFVAQCPLYRIDAPKRGSKPAETFYALDDGELHALLDKLRQEGARDGSWSINRFKGLGEMNAAQLRETAMDPATRRTTPVVLDLASLDKVHKMFTLLMSKAHSGSRQVWMGSKGNLVEADV